MAELRGADTQYAFFFLLSRETIVCLATLSASNGSLARPSQSSEVARCVHFLLCVRAAAALVWNGWTQEEADFTVRKTKYN